MTAIIKKKCLRIAFIEASYRPTFSAKREILDTDLPTTNVLQSPQETGRVSPLFMDVFPDFHKRAA